MLTLGGFGIWTLVDFILIACKKFTDENGDLILIVEYSHPGGQWSCTKSLCINISKDYKVEELKLNKHIILFIVRGSLLNAIPYMKGRSIPPSIAKTE